jgi:hypothetical protein
MLSGRFLHNNNIPLSECAGGKSLSAPKELFS